MKINKVYQFSKIILLSFMCSLLLNVVSVSAQEEVEKGLSALKKAVKFASRNVDQDDESEETKSTTSPSEIVIKKEEQPWLTNDPYLDDEYSQNYATAKMQHYKQKEKIAAECFNKHKDGEEAEFWKAKCQMLALSKQKPFKMPSRGSLEYVEEHYLPMQKLPKNAFGKALKGTLEELDELRTKTRSVRGLHKDDVMPGELSYEDVNTEICLIEEIIGRIIRKDYCHL